MKKSRKKWSKLILWFFTSSQTLWALPLENFLNNLISFQYLLMKIHLTQTYNTRKRHVKFQVHIFTQHDEMLSLVTDFLSNKPTVSAII